MSHITTVITAIKFKDAEVIKQAIKIMATEFTAGVYREKQHEAITFEQTAPDVITVRYAPIEGYQKDGNIHFVKDEKTGNWDMQLDTWHCEEEVQKVKEAFIVAYQQAPMTTYLKSKGYRLTAKKNGKNTVLTAVKY